MQAGQTVVLRGVNAEEPSTTVPRPARFLRRPDGVAGQLRDGDRRHAGLGNQRRPSEPERAELARDQRHPGLAGIARIPDPAR